MFSPDSCHHFSMQVMLLGFVLLGKSLEERARLSAASDMNELLVIHLTILTCLENKVILFLGF